MKRRKRNRGQVAQCTFSSMLISGVASHLDFSYIPPNTGQSPLNFDGHQSTSLSFTQDIYSNTLPNQADFTQNSFYGAQQPIPQLVESRPFQKKISYTNHVNVKTEITKNNKKFKRNDTLCKEYEAVRLFWDHFYRPANSDMDSEWRRDTVDTKWTKPWELYKDWCKNAPVDKLSAFKWISIGHGVRPGNVVRKENDNSNNSNNNNNIEKTMPSPLPFFNWERSEEMGFMQTNYIRLYWNISYSRVPENLHVAVGVLEMVTFKEAYLRYQKLSSKPVIEYVFHKLSSEIGVPIYEEKVYCVIEKFVFQKYQIDLFWKKHYEEATDVELSKADAFKEYTTLNRYCGSNRKVFHRVSIELLSIPYSPEKGDGIYHMKRTDPKELYAGTYHFRRFVKVVATATCPLAGDINSGTSSKEDSALKSSEDTLITEDLTEVKTESDEDHGHTPDNLPEVKTESEEDYGKTPGNLTEVKTESDEDYSQTPDNLDGANDDFFT